MTKIVETIINKDFTTAKNLVNEKLQSIAERKMQEVKKMIAAKNVVEQEQDFITRQAFPPTGSGRRERLKRDITEETEQLDEHGAANVQKMGRTKLVKVRIRGGKIQRRKKVSGVKGMTFRGGRLIRMSPAERRHRKMGARKAKIKRRGKMSIIRRKRKMSMAKRHRMGL
jgi:hypothetical protein